MNEIYPLQIQNNVSGITLNNRLEKLQSSAKNIASGHTDKIAELTKEFESFLLYYVLKSMREAVPKSDLLHSNAEDIFTSMMDQEIAKNSSQRDGGLGLAKIMQMQLTNRENQTLEDRGIAARKYSLVHEEAAKSLKSKDNLDLKK